MLTPIVLVALALLLAHAPMVYYHLYSLWQQEQYQYFPFVIGAFVWLLWTRWQTAPPNNLEPRFPALPWVVLVASCFLLALSILVVSPWLAYVSLVVGVAGLCLWIQQGRQIEYLWGIWLLLWLMVPLPLGVDDRLVRFLQSLSSQLSSTILDSVGILHSMSGNVLQLQSKEFFVDEACSGIVSVMSIIACAAIYAVWRNRSFVHLICLVLAGIVWALLLNVLRICTIAVAYHAFDMDLSTGVVHEMLGLVLFLAVFLALVGSDYLLVACLAPIDLGQLNEGEAKNPLVRLWNYAFGREAEDRGQRLEVRGQGGEPGASANRLTYSSALLLALPLLALGIVQFIWIPSVNTAEAAQAMDRALALDDQSMPEKIGPWIREGFEAVERDAYSDFGKYSRTYKYRHQGRPGVEATVSLDFPYLGGWHDLCVCYRNTGWTINSRDEQSADDEGGTEWSYINGLFEKPDLGSACALYTGFDASGAVAEPPGDSVLFRPWFRLRRRLLLHVAPQLYQVQVFSAGAGDEQKQLYRELEELLIEASSRFRVAVAEKE